MKVDDSNLIRMKLLQEEKANKLISRKLQILGETDEMRVSRVCTADGRPVIYSSQNFIDEYFEQTVLRKNIDFLYKG